MLGAGRRVNLLLVNPLPLGGGNDRPSWFEQFSRGLSGGDWRLDHKTSSYFLQHFLVAQGIEYKLVQLVFVFRTVTTAAAFPGNHSRTVAAHCYATIVVASRSCGAAASTRIKAADVTVTSTGLLLLLLPAQRSLQRQRYWFQCWCLL